MRTHGIRTAPGTGLSGSFAWGAPCARQHVVYQCDRGHDFTVTYDAAAIPPAEASCRCGGTGHAAAGHALAGGGQAAEHDRRMTQIRQRRTVADLEQILADRLAELAARRTP